MEYSQDRLRAEIRQLRDQIEDLDQEYNRQRSATMIAEILLCIVAFVTGVFVGAYI
jgi:F0F1-type ATP synthase assembly protein I